MAHQYIYVMKDLSKSFPGGKDVLKNIWLSFYPGAKIGIIGQNGSGKSTIMKIMGGLETEFSGEAWAAKGTKVGYLSQEPQLDPALSVFDNVMQGVKEQKQWLDDFNALSLKFCEPMSDEDMNRLLEQQGALQEKIDAVDAWNLEHKVEVAMDALSCPPKNADVTKISGGEKRRVALAKLLLEEPDLLLLDEPTNHLDAYSVAWLERFLQNYKGTVVLVTHDRYFLDNVVSWILELDRGQGIPYEGNYSSWLDQKSKRLETEKKQETSVNKQLMRELEWIRQSPKGRQVKSKARINAYETLKAVETQQITEGAIVIPEGPRLGENVIKANALGKRYGDRVLFDDLNFVIPRGAIVGVIGSNGRGKTTLFRIITGQEQPDVGQMILGDSVKIAYVDQSRDSLNDNKTIWEEISDGLDELQLGTRKMSSRAYCGWFSFKGTDQQKRLSQLSGGERNRVHLAKILKSGANVIMLDEPTNDLDIETLRSLEEALLNFKGCALVISHDRYFLDRIATHILAFEGNGKVVWHEGNYASYESTLEPEKFKFKKFAV